MASADLNGMTRLSDADQKAIIGKTPNRVIPVPYELRRQTLARERDTLFNELKVNTGCIVRLHWEQGKITKFEIFGAGTRLEKAVTHINQWMSKAHIKSGASSAWAKISAFDPNKWYYDEVEHMERERKEIFKGPIPESSKDSPKLQSTIVVWPEDFNNASITPLDVFGNKLESLDRLRMQDEVWIRLLRPQLGQWQIEIISTDDDKVKTAESHFWTLIEKIRTENAGHNHALNLILDDDEGIDVVLQAAEVWWPNRNDRVVPRLLAHGMMETPGSFRKGNIYDTQLSKIQHSVQLALEAVRQKQGSYDLAIRLGCVAMSSKQVKEDKIGLVLHKEAFLKDVNGIIDMDIKKWLADDELGNLILCRLLSASDFLEPTKSAGYYGHKPESLKQTRPVFRGTWVFRDPASGAGSARVTARHPGRPLPLGQASTSTPKAPGEVDRFVIQVDWNEDEDGMYERTAPRFYKLKPGQAAPKRHMDINLLELGESRGWHFALESLAPVSPDSVSPILTGFAERVKMQKNYDISSGKFFATWDNTSTIKMHLQGGRLDKVYSFGIKNTCYRAEFTGMWFPGQNIPVWGIAVRHLAWATHLAELENLSIGTKAEWGPTIPTFFPDDGEMPSIKKEDRVKELLKEEAPATQGIRILARVLMKLSAIVSSVTSATGGIAL